MFAKRFHVFTFAGIKVGIDISWLLIAILLSWTLATGYFPFKYPHLSLGTYWLMGVCGMLGLFVCIILHEMGHSVVAKYFKLPVSQITLFIFGGVAEIKKEPESPKSEFLMAVAGPIVSILLALVMYYLTKVGTQFKWPIFIYGLTGYLAYINTAIVIFNLIPAFPLDGGRIFRSILWGWKKDLGWATKISSRLGLGFGILLIFFGAIFFIAGSFLAGLWLAILGWFLQRLASFSYNQFFLSRELHNEKVARFMNTHITCVPSHIMLKEFVDQYMYQTYHTLYPVTENENLIGYIGLKEVKSYQQEEWESISVKKGMVPRSEFKTITPNTSVIDALKLMQETDLSALLVVEGDRPVGILTSEDLFKKIALNLELEKEKRKP